MFLIKFKQACTMIAGIHNIARLIWKERERILKRNDCGSLMNTTC